MPASPKQIRRKAPSQVRRGQPRPPTANCISAIVGLDGRVRALLLYGPITEAGLTLVKAFAGDREFIWNPTLARQWGLAGVFAPVWWIMNHLHLKSAPKGTPFVITDL